MEDWPNEFFKGIETAVIEVEKFFTDVTEEFNHMMDDLTQLSEEFAEEVQNKIIPDLDECLNEILEPILEIYMDLDIDVEEEEFDPFVTYVHPTATQNPACRGCKNYHGQVYGGNLLVCGMHPYGVEEDSCPDWESYGDDDDNPF
ncbi:hypothetical protein [Lyngbya sp. CCY1209]|uniref:hypothetical protein n=1 Tax=Lyngbya sp. CCY1209 TaxID=2886103 RepID=UPI002D20FBD5|nr:hypothetical protein [Lyngbya sp. CCY1209]MEB3887129.1 hypothetical protein [Lyngbya sp. CCY1209]